MSLTTEQKTELRKLYNSLSQSGLSTDRLDKVKCTEVLQQVYAAKKLDKLAQVFYVNSPSELVLAKALIQQEYFKYVVESLWTDFIIGVDGSVVEEFRVFDWDREYNPSWVGYGTTLLSYLHEEQTYEPLTEKLNAVHQLLLNQTKRMVDISFKIPTRTEFFNGLNLAVETISYPGINAGFLTSSLFIEKFFNKKQSKLSTLVEDTARHLGPCLFYKDFVIMSERPTQLVTNSLGELHNESGAAITFSNSEQVYALKGAKSEREVVEKTESLESFLDVKKNESISAIINHYGFTEFRDMLVDNGFRQSVQDSQVIDGFVYSLVRFVHIDGREKGPILLKQNKVDNTYEALSLPDYEEFKNGKQIVINSVESALKHRDLKKFSIIKNITE